MSHRILLVDDEVDILEFVRYNLVREGYEVFTAENGAEALKAAAECRPHLILLDMMMPVMDGAQTCRAIRQNPVLKDTMVVFLSALGEEGRLYAFDQDRDTRANCPDDPRFHYVESNFRFLRGALRPRQPVRLRQGCAGTGGAIRHPGFGADQLLRCHAARLRCAGCQ